MIRRAPSVFIFVFAIFLLQPGWLAARGKIRHSHLADAASPHVLPVRILRGYLVVAQGNVAGLAGRNFIIDTGTSPTIVDSSLVESLHLTTRTAEVTALGGRFAAGYASIPGIELGPIRVGDLRVMVADLSSMTRELGMPIAALVGLDVLGQSDFRIDFRHKKLEFGAAPRKGIAQEFQYEDSLATVPAEVHGKTVRLLVDTGAAALILFESHLDPELRSELRESKLQSSSLMRSFQKKEVTPGEITVGGKRFGLQRAFVMDDPEKSGSDFDGLLGAGAMGFAAASFDFASHTLYLEP